MQKRNRNLQNIWEISDGVWFIVFLVEFFLKEGKSEVSQVSVFILSR